MIEYKTMKIHPSDQTSTMNVRACFGWELASAQEINTKDSRLERRGDTIYSVTESENYVSLTFKRDDRRPNRNKLVGLENDYDNAVANRRHYSMKEYKIKKKLSYFKIIFFTLVIAVLFGVAAGVGLAVLPILVGVGLFFLRRHFQTKYSTLAQQFSQLANKLISEAKSLL